MAFLGNILSTIIKSFAEIFVGVGVIDGVCMGVGGTCVDGKKAEMVPRLWAGGSVDAGGTATDDGCGGPGVEVVLFTGDVVDVVGVEGRFLFDVDDVIVGTDAGRGNNGAVVAAGAGVGLGIAGAAANDELLAVGSNVGSTLVVGVVLDGE